MAGLIRAELLLQPDSLPVGGSTGLLCGKGRLQLHQLQRPNWHLWRQRLSPRLPAWPALYLLPSAKLVSAAVPQPLTHTYTRIHTHTHTHTHSHTHTHTHRHTHTHARTYACMNAHKHIHTHIRIHIDIHIQTHTHAQTYACMNAHKCTHTHAHTHTHICMHMLQTRVTECLVPHKQQ